MAISITYGPNDSTSRYITWKHNLGFVVPTSQLSIVVNSTTLVDSTGTLSPRLEISTNGADEVTWEWTNYRSPASLNYTATITLPDILDVTDFGAVGDGTTDDTAAIQAALNVLGADEANVRPARAGSIYFPGGHYRVSSTLTYIGAVDASLSLFSDGSPGRGRCGAELHWTGDGTDPVMKLMGAAKPTIRNIAFNAGGGTNGSLTALWITSYLGSAFAHSGSGSVLVEDCAFEAANASGAYGVLVGDASDTTVASAEMTFQNCKFINGTSSSAGFYQQQPGPAAANTNRGYYFYNCLWTNGVHAIDWSRSAGEMVIVGGTMSGQSSTAILHGASAIANSMLRISGLNSSQTASGAKFYVGTPGSGLQTGLSMDGCTVLANLATGGSQRHAGLNVANAAFLTNNTFQNSSGGGTNVFKITLPQLASCGPVTLQSHGNRYINATNDVSPFQSSTTDLFNGLVNTRSVNFMSIGDRGGDATSGGNCLRSTMTFFPTTHLGAPLGTQIGSQTPFISKGELRYTYSSQSIPKEVWNAGNTSQTYTICVIPPRWKITDMKVNVTEGYALAGSTLTARIGTDAVSDAFMVDFDAGAVQFNGTSAINYGTLFSPASTYVNGGVIPDVAADTNINMTLTSNSANLGDGSTTALTAGAMTFIITLVNLDTPAGFY